MHVWHVIRDLEDTEIVTPDDAERVRDEAVEFAKWTHALLMELDETENKRVRQIMDKYRVQL